MRILCALVLTALASIVGAEPPDSEELTKFPPAPTRPPPPTKEPPAPTLPPPTKPVPTLTPRPTIVNPTIIDPPPSETISVVNPTIIDPPPFFVAPHCICPNTHKLLCCKDLVSSLDPVARERLKELGIHIEGVNVPIGISCVPFDPLNLEEARTCRTPVCCQDVRKPEIAAISCADVGDRLWTY